MKQIYKNQLFLDAIKNLKINAIAPGGAPSQEIIEELLGISAFNFNCNYFDSSKSPFHSNSDLERFKHLEFALTHDSIDIIWNVRGGYGCSKLISKLEKMQKPKREKFFIGYSDITPLHIFLSQEWGWNVIHGSCLVEIYREDRDPKNFLKILAIINGAKVAIIDNLVPLNDAAKQSNVTAPITGGNLELLRCSIGTSYQINARGKIIFIEDINVQPYQVDRGLHHLKQAKILDDVEAVIFGTFDKDIKLLMYSLNDFAKIHSIPMFKTNQVGHEYYNSPIVYNSISTIYLDNDSGNYNLKMQL